MDLQLTGKVALVTGGARGIGRGIALTLAAEGVKVAVNYRERSDAAAEVVRHIREDGGDAEAIQGDVGVYAEAERLVSGTLERFGRIDILVNNAGVVTRHPILDVPLAEWDRVVRTNLYGCFHCSRLVGGHMVERGQGRHGSVLRHQSRHRDVEQATRGGAGSPSDQRQCGGFRDDHHGDQFAALPEHETRGCREAHGSAPPRALGRDRSAGGHRESGRVPGLRRGALHHRRRFVRRWRIHGGWHTAASIGGACAVNVEGRHKTHGAVPSARCRVPKARGAGLNGEGGDDLAGNAEEVKR